MINTYVGSRMKKVLAVILTLLAFNAHSAVFFYDDLVTNYVDGNIVGQNNWLQTSTATNSPIQYSTGKVIVGPTGQDVYKAFQTQVVKSTVTTLYTRIDITVAAAQNTGDYFFSLSDPAGTASNFYQRFFIRATTGGFNIGLQSTSGTGALTVWGTSLLTLNQKYTVVTAWDMVAGGLNDTFSVFINPVLNDRSLLTAEINSNWNSTTGTEPALTISALNLRQGSASSAPTVHVEELIVGDTLIDVGIIPEPSSFSLLGLGITAILCMEILRRRNE